MQQLNDKKIQKPRSKWLIALCFAGGALVFSGAVFAAGGSVSMGTIAGNLQKSLATFLNISENVALAAGIILIVGGILKGHHMTKMGQQGGGQVTWGQSMGMIVVGALLCTAPSFIGAVTSLLTGNHAKMGDSAMTSLFGGGS